ncbi:hypothetical protein BJ742DRAFT_872926, partial [Cladochytrium replicatum]
MWRAATGSIVLCAVLGSDVKISPQVTALACPLRPRLLCSESLHRVPSSQERRCYIGANSSVSASNSGLLKAPQGKSPHQLLSLRRSTPPPNSLSDMAESFLNWYLQIQQTFIQPSHAATLGLILGHLSNGPSCQPSPAQTLQLEGPTS